MIDLSRTLTLTLGAVLLGVGLVVSAVLGFRAGLWAHRAIMEAKFPDGLEQRVPLRGRWLRYGIATFVVRIVWLGVPGVIAWVFITAAFGCCMALEILLR